MKRNLLSLILVAGLSAPAIAAEPSSFQNFISASGPNLMDGTSVFRFAGIHMPEMHMIEDDARGGCPHGEGGMYYKLPTHEEQENWVKSQVRFGAKVQRIYVLSVARDNDEECGNRPVHILRPDTPDAMPQLNEQAMVVYDNLIALADKHGLRLILPFVDEWSWWGGRRELAKFYDEDEHAIYDLDSKTYAAYKDIIRQLTTRKNTITGRHYYDEKAIMIWETGNELEGTHKAFLNETSAWIKQHAPNQLVMDGNFKAIHDYALEDPNVDVISNHLYKFTGDPLPDVLKRDLAAVGGKKPYFVGEFGLTPVHEITGLMEAIVDTEIDGQNTAGAFVWASRGHRHEGGFYWHKEHTGVYSYHIPGFPVEGAANKEMEVIDSVRQAVASMNGQDAVPPLPVPEAPTLREIENPFKINWMGSPVGRYYDIQRATSEDGPWQLVGENISDGHNLWDPRTMDLFADTYNTLIPGMTYYYRVIAKNESGVSEPSNIQAVTFSQRNKEPYITFPSEQLKTRQYRATVLRSAVTDDGIPGLGVSTEWKQIGGPENGAKICHPKSLNTRVGFIKPGEYWFELSASDTADVAKKALKVEVRKSVNSPVSNFCDFATPVYDVSQAKVNIVTPSEHVSFTDEAGFHGPFAEQGDSLTWRVDAPWNGEFTVNVHFSGKWGAKVNSLVVNNKVYKVTFPETDASEHIKKVAVKLKKGRNKIKFAKLPKDYGFMFVKGISVTSEL
ncbi:CBM35 domain-containing protein [Agarivorans sp. Alg241-V36]|uniref:CBM35 domain-containing protein n=1 Tax=Agarivorans sp. Alg241-V36 TaxID=2305992 RepID=UPI0013D46920|nr:CBM35 domain-containing protein [Agarivorans sp. Alg241-V36]